MAKFLQVIRAVDERYYQWATAGLIILAAAQWEMYASETIADFFNAKGPDLVVTFFGTLLGFGLAAWIYRWQVADADAAAKRQAADQLIAEARRANELLSAERRREFDALSAERRQAAQAREAELLAIQQRRIDHIRWLLSILKQISNYAKGQADEMEKFVKEIEREPSEIHQLARIASYATQRFTRPDNEPTFHAYYTVFADDPEIDKHYGELLGSADYVIGTLALILEIFQRYIENLYGKQLALKAMLEQVANDLATLNLSMLPGGEQAKYHNSVFQRTVDKWLHFNGDLIRRSASIKIAVSDFTKPLQKFLITNPHFPGVNSIVLQLKNINVAFTDLVNESAGFKPAFNPYRLREPVKKLDAAREQLERGYNSAKANLIL